MNTGGPRRKLSNVLLICGILCIGIGFASLSLMKGLTFSSPELDIGAYQASKGEAFLIGPFIFTNEFSKNCLIGGFCSGVIFLILMMLMRAREDREYEEMLRENMNKGSRS